MLKRYLAHEFKTKNIEKLQNFRGIEVAQSLEGIVLPQQKNLFAKGHQKTYLLTITMDYTRVTGFRRTDDNISNLYIDGFIYHILG